ncbi:hypothetical protein DUNSADRAFT_13426 [Dunaliella salina]|uniref:Encoded protein n=1 Tax=Dunaliella salina TaxID=3046 RepID=A0ABQ7H3C7_DUNSA|nr:hypothetical protein DUNSADRAFT_13426 [Dunaliella salina]|eukprot:KAF5841350.1 hypothetical protein DUNSADRAFT_13426 [Dunaliella salina]
MKNRDSIPFSSELKPGPFADAPRYNEAPHPYIDTPPLSFEPCVVAQEQPHGASNHGQLMGVRFDNQSPVRASCS